MKSIFLAAAVCIAAQAPVVAQLPSAATPPSAIAPVIPSVSAAELRADKRLGGEVIAIVTQARLDTIAEALAQQTGIPIGIAPEISGRRINLFTLAPRASAGDDMVTIARLTGCHWTVTEKDGTSGYTLVQPESERKRDAKAIRESTIREENARNAAQVALRQSIDRAIAQDKASGKAGFGTYLSAFTPEEIAAATASAQERVQVIAAGDQRHFVPFFVGGKTFADLPPEVQQAFNNMTGRSEYTAGTQGGRMKPAVNSNDQRDKCLFGLTAVGGEVRLALYNPAEKDAWVSPFDSVSGSFNRSADKENDLDPEVARQIDSPKLVTGLPPEVAARKIRIPASVDRKQLASLLAFFAKEQKLASASESWIRTATTPPFINGLLPPEDMVTVGDALKQIARTFGQRMVYENGILYVTTLTRGRDLRAEMPADLWLHLAEKNKPVLEKKQEHPDPLSLDDLARIAALSPLQLDTLFDRHPAQLRFMAGMFFWTQDGYPVMHLYSLLTPEQRQQAESAEGLPLGKLPGEAGRWYRATGSRGLTWVEKNETPLTMDGLKPQHFYVRRDGDRWQFLLTRQQGMPLRRQIQMPNVVP